MVESKLGRPHLTNFTKLLLNVETLFKHAVTLGEDTFSTRAGYHKITSSMLRKAVIPLPFPQVLTS